MIKFLRGGASLTGGSRFSSTSMKVYPLSSSPPQQEKNPPCFFLSTGLQDMPNNILYQQNQQIGKNIQHSSDPIRKCPPFSRKKALFSSYLLYLFLLIQISQIMKLLNWFADEKKQQTQPRFTPKITINTKSNLHIEVQPQDPTNCSNIVITAFVSQQIRSIIPIRVEWSRFKVKSDSIHSVEKIHCLVGNTYMCQPGDVGSYIKAVVKSVDETSKGEAQVTVGPISIDVMMKRLIEGALYSGTLLSQVNVCQKDNKNSVTLRLNSTDMEFVDDNSGQKLVKQYSMSEPKIELNPKDSTRVYLRFQQDQIDEVRDWLNTIFQKRNSSMNESSLSVKVPYKSHSESSSKLKLFQKPQRTHCVNKIEMRFISRNSRDLFLFTQRAFICREDMKNSVYIQRIETLQTLATQQDYYRFLSYMCLKNQIIRLSDFAKELEDDRDAKIKDLVQMEESIGEMTLTYLKIIEEKGKSQQIDFEQSYSQINMTREEMLNRKNVREMKKQNEALKERLRILSEELQFHKFLKKDENESMIFNQTSNPFAKKNNQQLSVSYQMNSPEENKQKRKQMFEMSMNYTKILEENNELKKQLMTNKKNKPNVHNESKNMMELLGEMEKQEIEARQLQLLNKISILEQENETLKKRIDELNFQNQSKLRGINISAGVRSFYTNQSALNQSQFTSIADSMNQSITSEAAISKLQQNLIALTKVNEKLQEDSTRLRRERDFYRSQTNKLDAQLKQLQKAKLQQSSFVTANDNSMVFRFKEENQILQNEKKALMKKLESLSRENASGIREQFIQKQRKLKEYEQLVDRLKMEKITMAKEIQQLQSKKGELQFFTNENIKLKKINSELQQQIKSLKIELSINNDGKIEASEKHRHNSSTSSTKQKAYSDRCNQATVEQLEKYKREIKKLQEEIIFMKKSSDAINRSRDLTLQMDGYYEQKMEVMKKELEAVYHQNQNLSKMCQRYGKDAREANKQLNRWREKAMELMKARTEESVLLSN